MFSVLGCSFPGPVARESRLFLSDFFCLHPLALPVPEFYVWNLRGKRIPREFTIMLLLEALRFLVVSLLLYAFQGLMFVVYMISRVVTILGERNKKKICPLNFPRSRNQNLPPA